MNFLLTNYIYPLAQAIQLSSELNIQLDNPRGDDEISFVEHLLIRARDSGEDYAVPESQEEDVIKPTLLHFREALTRADSNSEKLFSSYGRETTLRFLASIFVIARYDDKGATEELYRFHKEARARGELTFSVLEEDSPIEKARRTIQDYAYLLALLANSEGDEYHGRGFIIAEPEPTHIQSKSLWFSLLFTSWACAKGNEKIIESDGLRWSFFQYAQPLLLKQAGLLDEAFKNGLTEKLLYVGSLLRLASEEAGDVRLRLITLTSILELLVTHSPDYNRFNVEESIGKQFRLKVGLLTYLNDKTRDIELIGRRLKTIYQQRSNIAHGNFDAMNKYVQSLSKIEGNEEYFDDLISDLYTYIRAVVEELLDDKSLVDFLKAN